MTTTPWGPAQHTTEYAEGITFYTTASHGGFHLSPERNAQVPQRYRTFAARWSKDHGDRWYEEDCAALAVVLTFPENFPTVTPERLAQYRTQLDNYCD